MIGEGGAQVKCYICSVETEKHRIGTWQTFLTIVLSVLNSHDKYLDWSVLGMEDCIWMKPQTLRCLTTLAVILLSLSVLSFLHGALGFSYCNYKLSQSLVCSKVAVILTTSLLKVLSTLRYRSRRVMKETSGRGRNRDCSPRNHWCRMSKKCLYQ